MPALSHISLVPSQERPRGTCKDHAIIAEEHPAVAGYLSRLAPTGRRAQRTALHCMKIIGAELNVWHELVPAVPSKRTALHTHTTNGLCIAQGAYPPLQYGWHTLTPIKINSLREALVKRFAPATARRMLSALKGVLKECWRQGLLDAETLARLCDIAPVPGRRLSPGRALTLSELSVLRGAAGPRDRALLAILAYGGLRRAEAASLTHADIAQEGPLEPRTDHGSGPPSLPLIRITVRHGKGDKERIL